MTSNKRGKVIAVRMPSSIITVINSINVKPFWFDDVFDFFTLVTSFPTLSVSGLYYIFPCRMLCDVFVIVNIFATS